MLRSGIAENLDLIVALENSNSISNEEFDIMKLYAKGIVDEYKFGKERTRGSLLTFSDTAESLVQLNEEVSREEFKDLIDSIPLSESSVSKLGKLLEKIISTLAERQNEVIRQGPVNVLILVKGE